MVGGSYIIVVSQSTLPEPPEGTFLDDFAANRALLDITRSYDFRSTFVDDPLQSLCVESVEKDEKKKKVVMMNVQRHPLQRKLIHQQEQQRALLTVSSSYNALMG